MFFRVGLWLFISHHLHSQFLSFRILCIASSAAAGGFLAFWLFGFLAFWLFGFLAFWLLFGFLAFGGFLALAFRILMLSQLVFGLGFLHPQHRKFLSGPPATPLSIKMHA